MSNDPRANKNLTDNEARTPPTLSSRASSSSRAERITSKLNALFAPEALQVEDDSAKHHGHAGARPEGETHYTVTMSSGRFAGQGRVARHRLVTGALKEEFDAGLHALALKLKAPGE
jgi:BolA family transcriptional regulator, general stress-responsive regulator